MRNQWPRHWQFCALTRNPFACWHLCCAVLCKAWRVPVFQSVQFFLSFEGRLISLFEHHIWSIKTGSCLLTPISVWRSFSFVPPVSTLLPLPPWRPSVFCDDRASRRSCRVEPGEQQSAQHVRQFILLSWIDVPLCEMVMLWRTSGFVEKPISCDSVWGNLYLCVGGCSYLCITSITVPEMWWALSQLDEL